MGNPDEPVMAANSDLRAKALLVSVGGSAPPIVATITQQRPGVIIFFVSRGSRETAERTVAALPAGYHPSIEYVETPSEQLVDECFKVLLRDVSGILERRGLTFRDLRADFTGGTKPMSAAVLLAFAGRIPDFSYVGGLDAMARDKGGLGVVVDGREQLLIRGDPWMAVAETRLSEAKGFFSAGRYAAARDVVEGLMTSGFTSRLAQSLRAIAEGFSAWDAQRYDKAKKSFPDAVGTLAAIAEGRGPGAISDFSEACMRLLPMLTDTHLEWQKLSNAHKGKQDFSGLDGRRLPLDLCAAARRRVEQRQDPEDGVMLLYAAVEKLAKGRLIIKHGIDNSRCDVGDLGGIREEVLRKQAAENGLVKLASTDSFRLLLDRGDEIGTRYEQNKELIEKLGSVRNYCWREHGYNHVDRSTFDELFPAVLRLLGAGPADLVTFPVPDWW